MDKEQSQRRMATPRGQGTSAQKLFSVQPSKTLRRFYRGVYNVFKKEANVSTRSWFNPEKLANQKREWMELRSQQDRALGWPEHNFEHLVVVGLPPTADTSSIAKDIRREKGKSAGVSAGVPLQNGKPHHTPPKPTYTPELLYQFPEDKPLHMSPNELVSFCFPDGVTPTLLPRSPSMSSLNEVVSGQQHLVHSDQSFVFLQRGGDDLPMFGVCYYVNQMVHVPPGLAKEKYQGAKFPVNKYLVSAPRCYCMLSRYPFFDLHFQVLNMVVGLERLDSIKKFYADVAVLPPQQTLSNRLGYGSAPTSFTTTATRTPEPPPLPGHASSSPSPPSSARISEAAFSGYSFPNSSRRSVEGWRTPTPNGIPDVNRRSFSCDRLGTGEHYWEKGTRGANRQAGVAGDQRARPRSQIQDSFSSIPGLNRMKRLDSGGAASVRETASCGISAGVRERTDRGAHQDGRDAGINVPSPSPSPVNVDSGGRNKEQDVMAPAFSFGRVSPVPSGASGIIPDAGESPFMRASGPPSTTSYPLSEVIDTENGRDLGSRSGEPTLAPVGRSCTPVPAETSGRRDRSAGPAHHWGHARSISGQSLRDFYQEEMNSLQEGSGGQPRHCRGDSAFYGTPLGFQSLPALSSRSSTPQCGVHHGMRSSDSELYIPSGGVWGTPFGMVQRTVSEDLLSVGGASVISQFYRSPSCGDLGRGLSPRLVPLLWGADSCSKVTPSLSVLVSFYRMAVPLPGEKIVVSPEECSQTIEYTRPKVKSFARRETDEGGKATVGKRHLGAEIAQIEAESAAGLRVWTVAALCRSLSLENVLSLLAAAMLEHQIVFFCSNIGVLTSSVLSLIPLLRPFTWESVLMPVVPTRLLDLLDAPVPFAVGLQHKTPDVAQRCAELVRVNLYKDRIKNAPAASCLPHFKQLYADLVPWHKRLQASANNTRRPMHVPTSNEYYATEGFLRIIGGYLGNLVGDLQRHTITEVGPAGRVSLLLEDSLVESFPQKDWPFMRAFVQTQMFTSHSDAVINEFS